jgi:vitamin B12 transporter
MPLRRLSTAALLLTLASAASAQSRSTLRGIVVSASAPIAGANVFLIETLEGALSDSAGRWSFTTTHTGPAMLVVEATGFAEVRRTIEMPMGEPITVVVKKGAHALAPTTVVASRYAASDERGATLTTLDVVATPGTNADVMRAIQTLPGVQAVDEGTGLYVRGGDYTETHVLVNDAVLHTAFTYESPNGTFIGTVDPFLLDGIYFSSGGFGARYGNVLSGLVALNTLGKPKRTSFTGTAGLAAVSASGAAPINKHLGLRLATNQFDTDLLFRVNGTTVKYDTPPRGYDRTGSVIWNYRPTGELKVFGIGQTTNLRSVLEDPSYVGAYAFDVKSQLGVLNWHDVFGVWSPTIRVSDTRSRRAQDYGAFRMTTGQRYSGASGQLDWSPSGGITLRTGAEVERNWSELNGSVPDNSFDKKPGARVTVVDSRPFGDRVAGFAEADMLVGARTRLITGLRQDHSSQTHASTRDPRVSAAMTLVPGLVLTTAWGVYHQVPDPLFSDSTLGDPAVASMRASHTIVGIQAGSSGQMIRLELFDKRYDDLAQMTRDFDVAKNGTGSARGADLFMAGSGFPGMRWRVSLSVVSSKRTDPNTGMIARAPFDVTKSVTTVINQSIGSGWHLGLSQHYATGRPFTPVVGAAFDSVLSVWIPRYGAAMSERLPAFRRVDLGLTHLRRIGAVNAVFFAGASNLFDRDNVFMYRYSADYSTRIAIRSLFKRSYYVGASVITQ